MTRASAKDSLATLGKKAAEHATAAAIVWGAVWFLVGPRLNAWADDRAKVVVTAAVQTATDLAVATKALADAQAAAVTVLAQQAASTAQLVALLVCLQAGGLPVSGVDAAHGRCLFVPVSGPAKSLPLSDVDALIAEITSRARVRP